MTTENKLLNKLIERQDKLAKEIKQAKAAQAKKEAAIYADKCRIVGAAILAELQNNENLGLSLNPIINERTTAAKDRKLLGLAPLPKKDKKTGKGESAKADT
ncbi:MAG: hypothetical protein GQ532_14275 [Methylomarinum sp.]|nr:hypothetical protein [Methylomarinum sp.]